MKRAFSVAAALLMVAGPAAGQGLPKGQFPDGFRVRVDRTEASAAEVVFVTMRPGWHVTTGPASILYDAALKADGPYRVDAEIFLFDPGERNEGYGVFIGGRDLESEEQAYTYFLVRKTGEFLVKRRAGSETSVVHDWTAHPAILRYADRGEAATAKNALSIDAGADAVRFLVNGAEVAALPRSAVDADGVVGLRVNHALNLHVSSLVVTRR